MEAFDNVPDLTSEEEAHIRADFARWTGGMACDSEDMIDDYCELSCPTGFHPKAVKRFLIKWADDPTPTQRYSYIPLKDR